MDFTQYTAIDIYMNTQIYYIFKLIPLLLSINDLTASEILKCNLLSLICNRIPY
jgi:hypothetical protein